MVDTRVQSHMSPTEASENTIIRNRFPCRINFMFFDRRAVFEPSVSYPEWRLPEHRCDGALFLFSQLHAELWSDEYGVRYA